MRLFQSSLFKETVLSNHRPQKEMCTESVVSLSGQPKGAERGGFGPVIVISWDSVFTLTSAPL